MSSIFVSDRPMCSAPALRRLAAVSACAIVAALGPPVARADIYTWTDASGRVNISNLKPPDNANVTRVYKEDPEAAARAEAARQAARESEVRALATRVQQLERELDTSAQRASLPPPPMYPMIPPPAPMPYQVAAAPPMPSYADSAPPAYTCDVTLFDCTTWWAPGYYAPSAIVVATPYANRHRFYPQGYRYVGAPAPWQPLRPIAPGYGANPGYGPRPPYAGSPGYGGQPGAGNPPGNGNRPGSGGHPMVQGGSVARRG